MNPTDNFFDPTVRLGYYLEDDPVQKEIMLDVLNEAFSQQVHFVEFTLLQDLKLACKEVTPHMVVSDLEVPDSDARSTLRFLLSLSHRQIPVFACSSHVCVQDDSFELVNNEYLHLLSKRSSMNEIGKSIRRIIVSHWNKID